MFGGRATGGNPGHGTLEGLKENYAQWPSSLPPRKGPRVSHAAWSRCAPFEMPGIITLMQHAVASGRLDVSHNCTAQKFCPKRTPPEETRKCAALSSSPACLLPISKVGDRSELPQSRGAIDDGTFFLATCDTRAQRCSAPCIDLRDAFDTFSRRFFLSGSSSIATAHHQLSSRTTIASSVAIDSRAEPNVHATSGRRLPS